MKAEHFLYTFGNGPYLSRKKSVNLKTVDEVSMWKDFLDGSDGALAYIYRSYVGKLYNYGRQIINDDNVVSDGIQDVFYELIKSRKRLSQTTSIKNYLYASLRRRLMKQQKSENKIQREHIDEDNSGLFKISFFKDNQSTLDQFSGEQIKMLEKACNALPVRQREALILLYYEELEYTEIAKIMKIGKVRSARALVYRAIDSLKHVIQPIREEFLNA